MSNLVVQVSPEQYFKELDITSFLLSCKEIGLCISVRGIAKMPLIIVEDYNFNVQNNKVIIDIDEDYLEIDLEQFTFQDFDSILRFTSKDTNLIIELSEV